MNLLLDTCAALWWWQDSPQLSPAARVAMADSRNEIHFSAASAMEVSTKVRLGKLALTGRLARDLAAAVTTSGWRELPLAIREAQLAGSLAWPHRDPFDRLLAVQCMEKGFTLVTCDPAFAGLKGLKVLW